MKKLSNRKSVILPLIGSVILVVLALFFMFNSLNIKASFNFLIEHREGKLVDFPIDFSVLQPLFFSIVVGFLATYFAILSIFLNSRATLSIEKFFYYTFTKLELFFLFLTCFEIILMLLLPCFKISKNEFCCFAIGCIFEVFIFAVIAFERLLCLENPKKCAKLFIKICKDTKKNEEWNVNVKTEFFYKDFVKPAFSDNVFVVFDSLHEYENLERVEKDFNYKVLKYLLTYSNLKHDKSVLETGLKTIRFYIAELLYKHKLKENDLRSLNWYTELFFDFYRNLFYCNAITYPYILECSIYYRNYLNDNHREKSNTEEYKEIARQFQKCLVLSKEMVIFSLHYCNSVDIHSHIKDFMNSVQMLELFYTPESERILQNYQRLFIDIVTHIINMVQMQRLDKGMLLYVYRALKNINEIRIFDDISEQYFEILPRTDFHTVIYSRNYYILILLILCKFKNDNLYTEILEKLRYKKNNSNDVENLYYILNERLKYITDDDLVLLTDDKKILDVFLDVKKEIETTLKEKKQEKIQNLFYLNNIDDLLKNATDAVIEELKEKLSFVFDEKDYSDDMGEFLLGYDFNVENLQKQNNALLKLDYAFTSNIMIASLCNQFINENNVSRKKIKSVTEIFDLQNETEIFVSRKCFDALCNDENIIFNGNSLEYKNKNIAVYIIESEKNFIILGSLLCKKLPLVSIYSVISRKQKRIENDSVIVTVPFHFSIAIHKETASIVYEIN